MKVELGDNKTATVKMTIAQLDAYTAAAIAAAIAQPVQPAVPVDFHPGELEVMTERGRKAWAGVETAPAVKLPLTDERRRDIATNWFAEEWAIRKALGVIDDCEAAHGIGSIQPADGPSHLAACAGGRVQVPLTEKGPCRWAEDDPWGAMPGTYASDCGELWTFNDGGPKENSVRFCQGCGRPVEVVPFPEDDAAPRNDAATGQISHPAPADGIKE